MATATQRALPPGPGNRLTAARLFSFGHDPLGFLGKLARRYGDIVHFRIGPQDLFLLNRPDYIQGVLQTNDWNFHKGRGLERSKRLLGEGLLTSEGELHRRQRRLAQPAFHSQRIAGYARTMGEYAARTSARWQDGATLDISQEMMRLTLSIVGKTLFDAEIESEAQEIGAALTTVMELFNTAGGPVVDLMEKLPLPSNRRFERARQRLDETIHRIIQEHRTAGRDHGDLISMLIMAQDEDGSGMSDELLRDEAMTLMLAGHETTANALTWTWYLLSQNPEGEAKLHAELDSVLAGRVPQMEDIERLPYTEMVLSESMRLYPPAWIMARRAVTPYKVGGYVVPARAILLMCQWLMHHDARWFPQPYRFDPERWTPEAKASRPRFSYFPFGSGTRVCIGEQFAWVEGLLVIATLAAKWRMRLVEGHPVALQPKITLRPKYGMRMTLERRG